jgi:hypothetical protein
MGSAMDAVFHLLAYAMTIPGLDRQPLLTVMAFMQGPGLRLVAPFIISFFLGSILLYVEFAKLEGVSKLRTYAYVLAFWSAVLGIVAATQGMTASRLLGLVVLAAVSATQMYVGTELCRTQEYRAVAALS